MASQLAEVRGYDVTLVENITDINDKIYDAAPGASAQLAARASHWYVEDTGRLGLGRPDFEPKASETVAEIVALIEDLIERGSPTRRAATSISASRAPTSTAGCRASDRTRSRGGSRTRSSGTLHFALWKGTKPGETRLGAPGAGAGRAGTSSARP